MLNKRISLVRIICIVSWVMGHGSWVVGLVSWVMCSSALAADTTIKGTTTGTDADLLDVSSTNKTVLRIESNGQIGIGQGKPKTTVEVDGDVSMAAADIEVTSGNQNNVVTGSNSFIKITSASGAFTITGFAGGVDGKLLIVWNSTSENMTIANEDGSSEEVNRIITNTTDPSPNRSTDGPGAATFIYDSAASRWIMTDIHE